MWGNGYQEFLVHNWRSTECMEVKPKEFTFFLVYDGEELSLALQVLLGRASHIHWIRGCMDPRAFMTVLVNSKFL